MQHNQQIPIITLALFNKSWPKTGYLHWIVLTSCWFRPSVCDLASTTIVTLPSEVLGFALQLVPFNNGRTSLSKEEKCRLTCSHCHISGHSLSMCFEKTPGGAASGPYFHGLLTNLNIIPVLTPLLPMFLFHVMGPMLRMSLPMSSLLINSTLLEPSLVIPKYSSTAWVVSISII